MILYIPLPPVIVDVSMVILASDLVLPVLQEKSIISAADITIGSNSSIVILS